MVGLKLLANRCGVASMPKSRDLEVSISLIGRFRTLHALIGGFGTLYALIGEFGHLYGLIGELSML